MSEQTPYVHLQSGEIIKPRSELQRHSDDIHRVILDLKKAEDGSGNATEALSYLEEVYLGPFIRYAQKLEMEHNKTRDLMRDYLKEWDNPIADYTLRRNYIRRMRELVG